MTYHTKPTGLASVAALAVGALIAFSANSANALTVTFSSNMGGVSQTINDGDPLDTSGQAGRISLNTNLSDGGQQQFGGFFLESFNTSANEFLSTSELTKQSLRITGGQVGEILTITTTENSFSNAAGDPLASRIAFSMGGSRLGGTLNGHAEVGGTPTSMLSFDPGSDGIGSFSDDTQGPSVLLSDPFTITTVINIGQIAQNSQTSFNANVTATVVPLPASALLLLGGLGGLGGLSALRRRKRAA